MAEIIDLDEADLPAYLCCLEPWAPEMQEAGERKARWYGAMRDRGLRVKIAREGADACGLIQYLPIEESSAAGEGLYFINCIWVHGHRQGVGNRQRRGLGAALLAAAEGDARSRGAGGMAAWGILLPFWMRAAWYRRHGYRPADRDGISQLLWKPFSAAAAPPRWIRRQRLPEPVAGTVTVTAFVNGWCPAMNVAYERAKRAAAAFDELVTFRTIDTLDRATFLHWGIADGLFVDGRPVNTGPPPGYEKLCGIIARRVRRLK